MLICRSNGLSRANGSKQNPPIGFRCFASAGRLLREPSRAGGTVVSVEPRRVAEQMANATVDRVRRPTSELSSFATTGPRLPYPAHKILNLTDFRLR